MSSAQIFIHDELSDIEFRSFWRAVDEISSETVPDYLKKIITAAGYNRYSAIKSFSDGMRLEVERFARENISLLFSPESIQSSFYLRNPDQFKLVPGHALLLRNIAEKLPEDPKHFEKVSNTTRYTKSCKNEG